MLGRLLILAAIDKEMLNRINTLVKEAMREPFEGVGVHLLCRILPGIIVSLNIYGIKMHSVRLLMACVLAGTQKDLINFVRLVRFKPSQIWMVDGNRWVKLAFKGRFEGFFGFRF